MAATYLSQNIVPVQSTSVLKKREGLPDLERLWRLNNIASPGTYSHSRKSSSDYCPSTPTLLDSPCIEQFYFGMDSEFPVHQIGAATSKGIDDVLMEGAMTPELPVRGRPQMLASVTSLQDSRLDHYAAVMNAAELYDYEDYEDELCGSDYGDYQDYSSDEDFEYATIEIASVVAISKPVLRPKLVDLPRAGVQRSISASSTSRHSNSSTVSKVFSQYSWTEEDSSNSSEHAEPVSEDEEIDRSGERMDPYKELPSPIPSHQDYNEVESSASLHDELIPGFDTSSPTLQLSFSVQDRSNTSWYTDHDGDRMSLLSRPLPATADVNIPSRKSSKHHSKLKKSKPSDKLWQGNRYSIFAARRPQSS